MDHVGADAVADPEVAGAAEAVAGNQQQVFLLGGLGEVDGVAAGGFDEQVEGAVGLCHFIAHGGKGLVQGLAVPVVAGKIRPQVGAPGDDFLPQAGGTDMSAAPGRAGNGGVKLLALGAVAGHIHVADPFTGEGQGLGVGIADDGIVKNGGDPGHLHPVGQLPVRLVGNDVNGVAVVHDLVGDHAAQLFQSLLGIDHAGGIVGRIQEDGLGVVIDHLLQGVEVDLEGGHIRRHHLEGKARFLGKGLVFREIGGNGQHLSPGNGQGPEHSHQFRGGAAADEELLRTGLDAVAAVQIVGDGLPGLKITHCGGIAVHQQGIGVRKNLADGLIHLRRGGNGGVADGVVVDVLRANHGGLGLAVFKQIPDHRPVGA